MIKAVFFDCDGVLVDSERVHQALNAEFIRAYQLGIDPKEFHILVGSSRQMNLWTQLHAKMKTRWSVDEMKTHLREFKADKLEKINNRDIMFPDVPGTLEHLKSKGLRIACASSSAKEYIDRVLLECGIGQYFDLVVSGMDFVNSKPSPEIYLFCAETLELKPEECLVIEDSPYGIQAAVAANMPVLARRDTLFHMDQSQATKIIDSLEEIPALLDSAAFAEKSPAI